MRLVVDGFTGRLICSISGSRLITDSKQGFAVYIALDGLYDAV